MTRITSAAVLGAGTMGAQIAAHLANAGIPITLLDVSRAAAKEGLDRACKLKPDPLFIADPSSLITTGGFDEDLSAIASADWIIEAIVERLEAKQTLLARVDAHRGSNAIVSSNTSGIPIASIAAGRSDGFRRHWLGTHFFNPPRYLRLVEIIPTPETDPAVVDTVSSFADIRLGKGVVIARDTPNFIANRLGLFGVMQIFRALEGGKYTIEEIDAITGPALGRPKSATFRTMDIAGIDVLAHVARNLEDRLEDPAERQQFALPAFVREMVTRGLIGGKAGGGFYRKQGDDVRTLDPATLEYRDRQSARFPALDAVRAVESVSDRLRTLFLGSDRVGAFLRDTLGPTLLYAARVAPGIAHSIADVDHAMRWGFGWELGPFETWDAIGPQAVLDACHVTDPPALVREALSKGSFKALGTPPRFPNAISILQGARVVKRNPGARLIDLGDGVLGLEFHSKMNAIGGDTIQMLQAGVREAAANFAALVVGNDAANFSAGANLMLLLLEAQEGNWDEVDLMVRSFQGATMGLKYSEVPVVVAPAGLALGGGCEIALHGARVQAAAETYMGLVEVGVGLIPAGGGTKELLARAVESSPAGDPLPRVQRVFETIAFAKVSTSGPDARRIGYLRDADGITMNRARLIADAKTTALQLAATGYQPPRPRTGIPVGGEGSLAVLKLGVHLAWRAGRISEHDAIIGRKLAWILAGGNAPHATSMSEQQMLDLEREAFLSLCGERKTQERIAFTLKAGKPLRN